MSVFLVSVLSLRRVEKTLGRKKNLFEALLLYPPQPLLWKLTLLSFWGLFLKSPDKFLGRKPKFEIKTWRVVAQAPAHMPAHFVLLADNFIVLLSKLINQSSWRNTELTQTSLTAPKSYRDFQEMGPWTWNKLFRGYQTNIDAIIYLVLPNNDIVYVASLGLKVQ